MSQLDIAEARTKLPELLVHSHQGRRSGHNPRLTPGCEAGASARKAAPTVWKYERYNLGSR